MKNNTEHNPMNNQDKATARPWSFGIREGDKSKEVIISGVANLGNAFGKTGAMSRANAALIVRSVNSHDELTASLEEILQCLMNRVNFENLSEDEQEAVRDAEAALNLAKGA
jgi:hypothetical protein